TPTHQACWSLKQQSIGSIPLNYLCAAGRLNLDGRGDETIVNRGDGRGARSGSRRLRFSRSALEDAKFNLVSSENAHQLHIGSLGEFAALADRPRASLPPRRELFNKLD